MALPDAENLAYRGITSDNAQCIAYRGFICGAIIKYFINSLRAIVLVTRVFRR